MPPSSLWTRMTFDKWCKQHGMLDSRLLYWLQWLSSITGGIINTDVLWAEFVILGSAARTDDLFVERSGDIFRRDAVTYVGAVSNVMLTCSVQKLLRWIWYSVGVGFYRPGIRSVLEANYDPRSFRSRSLRQGSSRLGMSSYSNAEVHCPQKGLSHTHHNFFLTHLPVRRSLLSYRWFLSLIDFFCTSTVSSAILAPKYDIKVKESRKTHTSKRQQVALTTWGQAHSSLDVLPARMCMCDPVLIVPWTCRG
jgi:hypothetical protein